MNYIVTNAEGLNVRAQMDTRNNKNIQRWMGKGEGFEVFQTYQIKGISGLQTWGRISTNAGDVSQEFVCLQIGNKTYARAEATEPQPLSWTLSVDAFLRTLGYKGPQPK